MTITLISCPNCGCDDYDHLFMTPNTKHPTKIQSLCNKCGKIIGLNIADVYTQSIINNEVQNEFSGN